MLWHFSFVHIYLSNSVVLSLLPLLYNHVWRLDAKITSEKIRFEAGSLLRMINKEWLAQFIYEPT